MITLKTTGQEVFMLPWDAPQMPQPWPVGYERVLIPRKDQNMHRQFKADVQVVHKSNLEKKSN